MRALTVKPPWSHAIMHMGKDCENRSWSTPFRARIVIHAGVSTQEYHSIDRAEWLEEFGYKMPPKSEMIFGAGLGTVEIYDCVELEEAIERFPDNPWLAGPYCWLLRNPKLFKEPISEKGLLGLWTWRH